MRVCVECGTPKFPLTDICEPCGDKTHTHDGEARRSLCGDCRNHQDGQCTVKWHLYPLERGIGIPAKRFGRKVVPWMTEHDYFCKEFDAVAGYKPSPNPLSVHDVIEIKLYDQLAFWLDPHRWDHVDDPRTQVMGTKPKEPETLRIAAGVGLLFAGLATALAVRR